MGIKIGRDGALYINSGSHGSPSWTEVEIVQDVTMSGDAETADADNRSAGIYGADVVVKLGLGVEFKLLWDTSKAYVLTLWNTFHAGTSLDVLVLDGPVGTTGSRGVRATCCINKFTKAEPIRGIQTYDVGMKPTYDPDYPPAQWTS
jgi:hypothetical protein